MTELCPKCLQPLPHEKENEIDSDLETLLEDLRWGRLVGLWGRVGYVTHDELEKRKHVELHAAHVGAFLNLLQLMDSIKNIELYDSLGTGDEESHRLESTVRSDENA